MHKSSSVQSYGFSQSGGLHQHDERIEIRLSAVVNSSFKLKV